MIFFMRYIYSFFLFFFLAIFSLHAQDNSSTGERDENSGFTFMAPIGLEGEFGPVYIKLALRDIQYIRNDKVPNASENASATYAKATAEIKLPFLPEQKDGSKDAVFAGDVFFRTDDEHKTNRIWLERDLKLPFLKKVADLYLIGKERPQVPKKADESKSDSKSSDKSGSSNSSGSSSSNEEECPASKIDKEYFGDCPLQKCECSYIEFDCNGITDVFLAGYLQFNDTLLVPVKRGKVGDKKAEETKTDKSSTVTTTSAQSTTDNKPTNVREEWVVMKDKKVVAHFSFNVKDGITSNLCFNYPFKLKKAAKNFVFEVHDAVLDISTTKNAPGFTLPAGYLPEGFDTEAWTGVGLKELTCYFPEDFRLNDGDSPTSTSIKDMLIDDYGFTGKAVVNNLVDKKVGGNAGVHLKISEIGAEVLQNHFINGYMTGTASVPFLRPIDDQKKAEGGTASSNDGDVAKAEADKKAVLDENDVQTEKELKEKENKAKPTEMDFSVRVSYNENREKYDFAGKCTFKSKQTYGVPFTDKATVTVNPGTGLYLFTSKTAAEQLDEKGNPKLTDAEKGVDTTSKLGFRLVMNGSFDMKSAATSKGGSSKLGFDCSFEGFTFEGLKFCNLGQKVSIDHLSTRGSAGVKFMGLTIAIKDLGWDNARGNYGKEDGKDIPVDAWGGLTATTTIGLAPKSGGDFGAEAKLKFKMYHQEATEENKSKWHFGGIDVGKIAINIDKGAFSLKGSIDIFKDDSVFGKGFKGQVDMKIPAMGDEMGVGVQLAFGKTPPTPEKSQKETAPGDLHYWFTKANATLPGDGIPVFSGCYIKSLSGGAYFHMMDETEGVFNEIDPDKMVPEKNDKFRFADVSNYIPTEKVGLGLIFGMGLTVGGNGMSTVNAEAQLQFTPSFALKQIVIGGDVSVVTPTPPFCAGLKDALQNVQDKMDEFTQNNQILNDLRGKYMELAEKRKKGDKVVEDKSIPKDIPKTGTIRGTCLARYRPSDKFFKLDANVELDFNKKILYGEGTFNMLMMPEKFYIYAGTDTAPCYVHVLGNVAKGRAYFMAGQLPHANIQSLSQNAQKMFTIKTVRPDQLADGGKVKAKGVAFGVNAQMDVKFDKVPLVYAGFFFDGGTDLILTNCRYNYEDKCRKWRGEGNLYGYVGVDLGVKWPFPEKKWSVIKADAFVGLKGMVPAPIQGEAVMNFHVEVGGFIEFWPDIRVSVGGDKNVTCGNCEIPETTAEEND